MLPTHDEVVAQRCRNRFYRFFLEFWQTIEAVELVPNWHIEYICDELQAVYEAWASGNGQPDVLLNVPPGTSKSTTVTQLFPAWLWLMNPATRIISSSYASSLSVSHAVKTRDCLRSDKFELLFPGLIDAKADEDGKTAYRNTRGGQRYATSTGGAVTGVHADFIILDDPLKPDEASSDAGLSAAASHLKTLSTRKTDKARSVTILVMQRLNEKDPAGIWLDSGRPLRHICLPGELPTDPAKAEALVSPPHLTSRYTGGLLDPRRLNHPALNQMKKDLGSYGYAGQVMQQPSPEEGGLLKKAWFRTMPHHQFLALPGAAEAVWQFDADPAYTAKQTNDPTGFLASCYLSHTLYVLEASEHWLEFPELTAKLPVLCHANGYGPRSALYVEPKASGKSVVQQLRASTSLNVIEAPAPEGDKQSRVNTASPFIEAGRVVLIDAGWNEAFVQQCAAFPTAAHDDMLDCLTQAIFRHTLGPPTLKRARLRGVYSG
ncbi:phage terminase large subunit [Hymenobacter lapidiphilus]|uniref:Phage terminase large subunit n=1 Tax=Hymenobacter lapidiphilus TaxID=2608003 RepID=A0A7Y7PSW4_9BACT|nr:phage terminase large subunit [Hymenobacter lapidiphilus]NVO33262.1 phage terminase large subunit [Hymenobacter lapidiphilus]